jgi:lysyl endopeptidase
VSSLAQGGAVLAQTVAQAPLLRDMRSNPVKQAIWPVGLSGSIREVRVGPLDLDAIRREDEQSAGLGDKRIRYGIGRDVRVTLEDGAWIDVPDAAGGGRLWRIDLVAEGARGVRVHLKAMQLPAGATVVVYDPNDPADLAGSYEGAGPHGDGTVWTPTRGSDRVRVECYFPVRSSGKLGVDPFHIDSIQQIYRDPTAVVDGPCHNDVTCHPGWQDVAKACGGIGFVSQNSIFCSGQLMNTISGDQTPYFLTSHTCVNTATVAQSCEVFFGYRSLVCNGPAPALPAVPRASGCTLLASNAAQDFSLLMIEGTLPGGVAWAGWTTATPPDGSPVATVHYPQGGPEKISFGTKTPNPTCGGPGFIRSNWTSGPTEPGSGGAGLFTNDPLRQLVGVLSCGWSSCGNVTNDNFSPLSAMFAAIGPLLAAGSDDAFEPNDRCGGAFSVSPGSFPYRIVKSTSEDWFTATVAAGATFSAQMSFVHANGDIDAELFTECETLPVAASTSQTGSEQLTWTNTGTQPAVVIVRIYLASDTRNTYTLSITNGAPPGMGACCLSGTCSVLTQAVCVASGGVFAGDGTTCALGCTTASYVGPAVAIADGTTSGCGTAAIAQLSVPESFPISGISVGVWITHGYQGDLKFALTHMGTGTTVSLVDRPGSPPSTFGFANDNYGASATNLFKLLDAAPQRYDTPVIGIDNVTGAWKPESPLTPFIGQSSAGPWQLRVQDCASGESGQLAAFSLTLGRASVACYANCDQSASPPILTANDFLCFINLFAEGDSRANCDGSTTPPVLTGNDFQCFLTSYVAGCS